MAKGEGNSRLLLLVLIGLLGAGGYNYHRNYQVEAAVPRPYKAYSEADLQALLAAYQGENSALEARYESAQSARGARSGPGLLDENVKAFEAAQRRSQSSREIGQKLSMQQAAAREIESELDLRRDQADVMKLHLKRLLTI